MEKNNGGTNTELLLLYELYKIADEGYFPKIYQEDGIKMKQGTISDITYELGHKPSGFLNLFLKKCINFKILKFTHTDMIRGKFVNLYEVDKERITNYLIKIPVFRGAVKLMKKEATLIIGSKFEEEIKGEE